MIATGYGRKLVRTAGTTITEITCQARGVRHSVPDARTIVDIGGQDSKLVRLKEDGAVADFVMNDRCAAGTGRFLEMLAAQLGTSFLQLGSLVGRSRAPAVISSMCVVFAESEIVGLLATGVLPEDIVTGVQTAIATRIAAMTGRKLAEPILFTGGVALVPGMGDALAAVLGRPVRIAPQPQLTCRLGGACWPPIDSPRPLGNRSSAATSTMSSEISDEVSRPNRTHWAHVAHAKRLTNVVPLSALSKWWPRSLRIEPWIAASLYCRKRLPMVKDLEKRRRVMQRSMQLGHCICDPRKPCPCDLLTEQDLCPCAGEEPPPGEAPIRLTELVENSGCASKIDQAALQRILGGLPSPADPRVLIGMPAGDDAGVYLLDEQTALVQTVDVFTPPVDDPYVFGQIAAANSLSDVYAMGGRPITALSIVGFPAGRLPDEVLRQILRGGLDKMSRSRRARHRRP